MFARQSARKAEGESVPAAKRGIAVWNGRIANARNLGGLFSAFVIIVDFEQHAALLRFEWAVMNAGRPAGIGRAVKSFATFSLRIIADDQIAGEEINLFPMIVHKGRGREHAGVEAQQARPASGLGLFVDIAREGFLLDAGRIALRRRPARTHIERRKFEMRFV